jgi:hypothetical protein
MSAKPSTAQLPTWDTNLTNTSAITAAHKTDGFLANAVPTSGELNTLFAFFYLWIQYVSDGAFSGASSFDNTLAVTGAATLTGGATIGVNNHVAVSGTGTYKRGPKVRKIPVCAGSSATGNVSIQWSAAATGAVITMPIELLEGERLLAVTARVSCSGAADSFQMKVLRVTPTNFSTAQLGVNQNSVGHAGALEALTQSSLLEGVSSADNYNYVATITALGYTTGSTIYGLEVTTDVP